MAITNGYATLKQVKHRLGIENDDVEDDAQLELVIESTSRWIEKHLNRRFYASSETRYYTAFDRDYVLIDDLQSVTTLKTDDNGDGTFETTWSSSDYILAPYNASTDSRPYTKIEIAVSGSKSFPLVRKGVELAGSFGYSSATPKAIQEACILISMRVWKRKDLPFGVAGSADLGTTIAISNIARDGEVRMLLGSVGPRITV